MAHYEQRYHPGGNNLLPPVILNLLIANGLIFLLQMLFKPDRGLGTLEMWLALWPLGDYPVGGFFPWQLLTYGFLHSTSTFTHIFFNMLALWMFGRDLENEWGSRRFAIYYLGCIVGAGLIQLVVTSASVASGGWAVPTLGASGGTFGILLAYAWRYPDRQIMLLIPPIPMKARYFVIIFGAIELFLGASRMDTGVAHFAHLGGMLFGALIILYWRGRLPIKPKFPMRW